MKHISKLLVLVLALVMVLSVFAGCGPTDPTVEPTDPQTQTNPKDNQTDPPAQKDGIFPLAEKKTFKIYVKTNNDWETNLKVNGWYQELVERTNVEIEFIPLGTDKATAGSSLNNAFQAGDYGHGYIGDILTADQVVDAGEMGFLKSIESFVTPDIMPGYCAALTEYPGSLEANRTTDGNVYTLARLMTQSPNSAIESPLVVNAEWLKKAGLDDVSTIEKFEKYLKYVKENDMNGNGDVNDEIPFLCVASSSLDAQATLQGIMNWWGVPTKDGASEFYVVINDGVAKIAPETEAYRAAITKVAEWYKAGYLWDQFFTGKTAALKPLVLDSQVPVVGAYNTNAFNAFDKAIYGDTNEGNDQNDGGFYKFVGVPVPEGYTPRMFLNPGLLGTRDCYAITTKCSDEEAKILLAWMDMAFLTIEGSEGSCGGYWEQNKQAGFEKWTNTFEKDESGKLVAVELTADQKAANKAIEDAQSAGYCFYHLCGSFSYCYPPSYYANNPSAIALRFREMGTVYNEYLNDEIWTRPYKTADQTAELSFLWPDVKSVITEYEAKFIKGDLEINDANWQAYMKALYKAGSKDLNAVLQDVYNATLGN